MAAVVTRDSDLRNLRLMTVGLTLRLFVNDVTPTRDDKARRYAELPRGSYQPVELGKWQIAAGRPPVAKHPKQVWEFKGESLDVYGWFLTADDGTLICAERFSDGPYDVRNDGDTVTVQPVIKGKV